MTAVADNTVTAPTAKTRCQRHSHSCAITQFLNGGHHFGVFLGIQDPLRQSMVLAHSFDDDFLRHP